jgi:hypothetical protein
MSFFDLDPTASANMMDQARLSPLDPETLKPGWFAGAWKAPVTGLASAVNDAALLAGDAGTPVLRAVARPIDEMFKTNIDAWLTAEQQKAVDNIKNWAPDPRTSGTVSQAVHGLFNVIPEAVVGGPETAAVLQGYKGYRGGMADGLDPGTAFGVGAIDGITTWAGMHLPMQLSPYMGAAANIGSAAAINVPFGMASRGVTGSFLRSRGYNDMADQYQVMDSSAITMDLIMGGGFGALAHYGPGAMAKYEEWKSKNDGKLMPSDQATAMYLNSMLHAELDIAPGIPADPAARAAHVEAVNKAIEDLLAGRDVNVDPAVTDANFVDNPTATATRMAAADAINQHLGPDLAGLQDELAQRGLPTDPNLYNITGPREPLPPQVRVTSEVKGIIDRATKEGWDNTRILQELEKLSGKLDERNAAAGAGKDRVRGALWINERLTRAERRGELSAEEVGLAKWLIEKNPRIADDLGLSIREGKGDQVGGMYNPIGRLATIMKGGTDPLTTVHEFLHHTERMMPDDVRAGIQRAWMDEVKRLNEVAKRTQNHDLMQAIADVLKSNGGDDRAHERVVQMVKDGLVGKEFYALVNASEFWAVNASKLVRARAQEGWVKKAVQWVKELVEKAKGLLGLRSDAAVIRGLDAVLKSDGTLSGDVLAVGAPLNAMKDGGFRRWFGGSKIVDAQGNPKVMYHGTLRDFATFDPNASASSEGSKTSAIFVTERPDFANDYASGNGGNVMPVFVKAENAFDYENPNHIAALEQYEKDNRYTDRSISNYINNVKRGDWETIEARRVQNAIKALGHDGFYVHEYGVKNLAVFDPAQIKSATGNNGNYDPTNPNILMNVEAPGTGVEDKNMGGFAPALRVKVPVGKMAMPDKPLILQDTNLKNAARQIAGIDEVLAKFPDAAKSALEWARMLAYAFKSDEVVIPPYNFIKEMNSSAAVDMLKKLSPGQLADADHGFANSKEYYDLYTSGQMDVTDTGKLLLWSFLSKGVSPYVQESMFLDAFHGIDPFVKLAGEGKFTKDTLEEYYAWANTLAGKGSGKPGAGTMHNLNGFGRDFLLKMNQVGEDGRTHLQRLHDLMADPTKSGRDIRREFHTFAEGVGIDNKVLSFTLLVTGRTDVMVLDRVQFRHLWDDGRFAGRNLYDGTTEKRMVVDKKTGKEVEKNVTVTGTALANLGDGARGLLIYEAIERALEQRIDNIYTALGRPQDASVGRYHWETWVADSAQEASHGSIDAVKRQVKGEANPLEGVTAKEGQYDTRQYGARYGLDANGMPFFRYADSTGTEYNFDVASFRSMLDEMASTASGVIQKGFKITDKRYEQQPWFTRPDVNRQALDALVQRYGRIAPPEEAASVQRPDQNQIPNGPGSADRAARPADPYSAEALIANSPGLTYIGADGTMVSAGRALMQADEEIAAAKRDSQGYDAAVACALRG